MNKARWKLIWSDEFEGPQNTPPNQSKWGYDLGRWGNGELETYADNTDNVYIDGKSCLIIQAMQEGTTYKSGRIKTKGLFEIQHGRIEACIKIPSGQGIWPAFWMLGNDVVEAGWPQCGEIDIMENIGREPSAIHSTLHGPGYSGAKGIHAEWISSSQKKFYEDFHIFGTVWSSTAIEFNVDGKSFARFGPNDLPRESNWVFNKPFFILLNVAIGGNWAGSPDATTIFPQKMIVDWIRVWKMESRRDDAS